MALSTCLKCGSHAFEVKEAEPTHSLFKLMFVQCSSCGSVVGVTDYFNTASLLKKIATKLGFTLY